MGLSTSLLVAACGDRSSATNADSPSAAGVAVRLGCRDTFRASTDAVPVGPKPVAQGHCAVQGRDVDINVFENALVRVQADDLGKVFLCGATNGAPDVKVWVVEDANWIASPRDAYAAKAAAAHASLTAWHLQC